MLRGGIKEVKDIEWKEANNRQTNMHCFHVFSNINKRWRHWHHLLFGGLCKAMSVALWHKAGIWA